MNEHVQNVKPVPPIARPKGPAHVIKDDSGRHRDSEGGDRRDRALCADEEPSVD